MWDIAKRGIKFRHPLTHSSGLSDSDLEGEWKTSHDLWWRIFNAPLRFKPGSAVEYSDLGYRLLGKILEIHYGKSLEILLQEKIFSRLSIKGVSYSAVNPFNCAGCPDAHAVIDDEQVRFLGGTLGCDGLFGSADALFNLISLLISEESILGEPLGNILSQSVFEVESTSSSYFDTLAVGSKTLGWEVNSSPYNYFGKFNGPEFFEKAGVAGTFIWFDQKTKYIFVYLTNHGKPKPFEEAGWNQLVENVGPRELSNLIYENLKRS